MHRIMAAVLAASTCASPLQAQTATLSTEPVLSLDAALEAAGASSPAIDAAQSGIRAAAAQRTVAGLRPNPSIDGMVENVAGTGDYRGLRSAETTVGVSLPIELGGKRAARIAVADAQLGRASLDAAMATRATCRTWSPRRSADDRRG